MCIATRTTITLDDELLKDAKREALERGTTLAALVQVALRAELTLREAAVAAPPFELLTVDGPLGDPGFDIDSNAEVSEYHDRLALGSAAQREAG